MLEFLGHKDAHDAILGAIERTLQAGPAHAPLTADMGGKGNTVALGKAIAEAI
jgi:tartrate dehydrogenase/decarboxylase/D-malate dehydrogenase